MQELKLMISDMTIEGDLSDSTHPGKRVGVVTSRVLEDLPHVLGEFHRVLVVPTKQFLLDGLKIHRSVDNLQII